MYPEYCNAEDKSTSGRSEGSNSYEECGALGGFGIFNNFDIHLLGALVSFPLFSVNLSPVHLIVLLPFHVRGAQIQERQDWYKLAQVYQSFPVLLEKVFGVQDSYKHTRVQE